MSNREKKGFQLEAGEGIAADFEFGDKTWKSLENAIHQIYNKTFNLNFADLYRMAYFMVLYKHGEKLYSGLVSTMTLHLNEISETMDAANDESFLEELNNKWNHHNKALGIMTDIFMYMERTYIPATHKTPIKQLGLNLWRDNIVHASKIQARLINIILEQIRKERIGGVIDRELMRSVAKMFIDLGSEVYQEDFEKGFIEASTEYYKVESLNLMDCGDCEQYLKIVELRLNEEKERVANYLDAKTEVKIVDVVKKEMIVNQMPRLVQMKNSDLLNVFLDNY